MNTSTRWGVLVSEFALSLAGVTGCHSHCIRPHIYHQASQINCISPWLGHVCWNNYDYPQGIYMQQNSIYDPLLSNIQAFTLTP